MRYVLALVLLAALIPAPAAAQSSDGCTAFQPAPGYEYTTTIPASTTGTLYASTPTRYIAGDERLIVSMARPYTMSGVDVRLFSHSPFLAFVCQGDAAPSVIYLPLVAG